MQNLLQLIFKYSNAILFVLLEVICFLLIVNFNKSQNEIFIHSANLFSGKVNNELQKTQDYFTLNARNDSLLRENAKLLETIINFRIFDRDNSFQKYEASDTLSDFTFIPARISNKTIHLRNNHITLSKGSKDGIKVGDGVISQNGIVGIVKEVSEHYSHVITILHSQSKISASLLKSDFHGTLIWASSDPSLLKLITLPKHASVATGDTIVTSGYSTVFPFGLPIGKIENYEYDKGGNYYELDVRLFTDIANLSHVYIVKFPKKEEKEAIQEEDEI